MEQEREEFNGPLALQVEIEQEKDIPVERLGYTCEIFKTLMARL